MTTRPAGQRLIVFLDSINGRNNKLFLLLLCASLVVFVAWLWVNQNVDLLFNVLVYGKSQIQFTSLNLLACTVYVFWAAAYSPSIYPITPQTTSISPSMWTVPLSPSSRSMPFLQTPQSFCSRLERQIEYVWKYNAFISNVKGQRKQAIFF